VELASNGVTSNAYRFAGEQYDDDLLSIYLRNRNAFTSTGRFQTRDKLEGVATDPSSKNLYPYVANGPINNVDYSGNETIMSLGARSSIGGNVESTYLVQLKAATIALALLWANYPQRYSYFASAQQYQDYLETGLVGEFLQVNKFAKDTFHIAWIAKEYFALPQLPVARIELTVFPMIDLLSPAIPAPPANGERGGGIIYITLAAVPSQGRNPVVSKLEAGGRP
jgi:RHS repeat-associated protein